MLPFLRKSKDTGVTSITTIHRAADKPEESEYDGVREAAKDLIDAIKADDITRACAALRAAYEIMASEPREDESQVEPHSYDAQNQE